MQIAVISDLHLGCSDETDCFGHDDFVFEGFLRRLESDFDLIVLLGDVWETLTSSRPYDVRDGFARAKVSHSRLARRFETRKYLYVHGNHDLIASEVDGAPAEFLLDVDGQRLLFTHGHHHDFLIRRARWLSECLVWLGGWARRAGLRAVYRMGCQVDTWLCGATAQSQGLDSFQRWALSLGRQRNADIVVTGHTHLAHRNASSGQLFLNSGSCCNGALSYLAMDTRKQVYEVCVA